MPTTEEKGTEILRMAEAWQQDWASEHDDPTGLCERASVHLIPRLLDVLTRSQEEVERLREALGFYADPETYFAWGFFPDSPCGDWGDDFEETDLGHKPGARARRALEEGGAHDD